MLDKDDVRRMEALARLRLGKNEQKRISEDLERIIDYFSTIDAVDTEGVSPMTFGGQEMGNVFRDDRCQESLHTEQVFRNAPQRRGNQFQVPRVL